MVKTSSFRPHAGVPGALPRIAAPSQVCGLFVGVAVAVLMVTAAPGTGKGAKKTAWPFDPAAEI